MDIISLNIINSASMVFTTINMCMWFLLLWLNPLDLQLDMVCKRLTNLFKKGLPIKTTPRAFHCCGENGDHINDFLDEEDSVYGNNT
jgi:hypothetical protein